MELQELAPGLWRWSAERAGSEIWCVYYETPTATVLIDPVVPDEPERFFCALDRDVERRGQPLLILCTSAEHGADAAAIADRCGAVVLTVPTI